MKTTLLDVNLLIALSWPAHEHHDAAHAWFGNRGNASWATCPLTELAFVRIVSNPAFSTDALAPAEALALLRRDLAHPRHEFWPDDVALTKAVEPLTEHLQGHRQIVDAYLLALAWRRKGIFASFDAGLRSVACGDRMSALEIVPRTPSRSRQR